jgi:hypothetical protein
MPYRQEISQQSKGCFLFLVNQSRTMAEPWGESGRRRCDEAAIWVNHWLEGLIQLAGKRAGDDPFEGPADAHDSFDVAVLGYGMDASGRAIAESVFQGALARRPFVSIVDVDKHSAPGKGLFDAYWNVVGEDMLVRVGKRVWIDPKADGAATTCHAFFRVFGLLAAWIADHPASFPPIVIHVTDGQSHGRDPNGPAAALKSLHTSDGNVLLFHCCLSTFRVVEPDSFGFHVEGMSLPAEPLWFPASAEELPDDAARALFEMSSVLPETMRAVLTGQGFELKPGARGMSLNTPLLPLLEFFELRSQVGRKDERHLGRVRGEPPREMIEGLAGTTLAAPPPCERPEPATTADLAGKETVGPPEGAMFEAAKPSEATPSAARPPADPRGSLFVPPAEPPARAEDLMPTIAGAMSEELVSAPSEPAVERRAELRAAPLHPLDENVQFSVYRPNVVRPEKWYPLLAFAHLSERRPDAEEDEPDPIKEVQRQARLVLEEKHEEYTDVRQDSRQAVPREGEITFVPEMPGVEFNPPSRSFFWTESVHREEFRLRALARLEGQTARGRLTVWLGSVILAEVDLAIRVDSGHRAEPSAAETGTTVAARPYRRIFASYSHDDVDIVEEFERYFKTVGDRYLRDWIDLRAGEVWSERLEEMIREADLFQLFWSTNSMGSRFVRQEWEYALGLGRPHFVRPVYWEDPMPDDPDQDLPPEELLRLHFQRLPAAGGPHAALRPRAEARMVITCPRCGKRHLVAQEHVGRQARCGACGASFTIAPAAASPPARACGVPSSSLSGASGSCGPPDAPAPIPPGWAALPEPAPSYVRRVSRSFGCVLMVLAAVILGLILLVRWLL